MNVGHKSLDFSDLGCQGVLDAQLDFGDFQPPRANICKVVRFLSKHVGHVFSIMFLAAVCNVKCGDGTPLKHMGRYVLQPCDVGRSRYAAMVRTFTTLQVTCATVQWRGS